MKPIPPGSLKQLIHFANNGKAQMSKKNRKHIKKLALRLLRQLNHKIKNKWLSQNQEQQDWDFRDAAKEFHFKTGCLLNSAIRYFQSMEDDLEWFSILGREPSIKDRVFMGYYPARLPDAKLPRKAYCIKFAD